MPKKVAGLGINTSGKNPPPLQMGKLNLQSIGKAPQEEDEEMKNETVPQVKQAQP